MNQNNQSVAGTLCIKACKLHCVFQGVTYCGTSRVSNLTMENVPWHEEVLSFAKKLRDLLPDYDIASEHEHSNCVLLAHQKVIHCSQPYLYMEG
jgi:wyosine [tRNA(Phe)-imidazoG37] synthetase (radical SAM superfamily)